MSKTLIRSSQQKLSSRPTKNNKPSLQMLMKNHSGLSKCGHRPQSRYSQISDQSSFSVYKKRQMKQFVKTFKENQQRYHFLLKSSEPKTKTNLASQTTCKNLPITQKNQTTHFVDYHSPPDKETHTKTLIEDYEKRIEEILKAKLLKKSQNKTILSSRIQQDQLDQELNKLIEQLKEIGCEMDDDETDELLMIQMKEIDQRIVIFEKIIAESFTESEMLKRFYYARKCLRKTGTQRKQISKMYRSCDNIGQYKNKKCSFPQAQAINFRTNNQLSFIKPKRQDYQSVKNNKENRYAPKRQILPKSSYQQQFKSYGILPTYKHRKSENYINFAMNQNRNSTYRGDYHQKYVKKFDSKALDCRKDKIKPGKIPFMGKQYSNAPQNQQFKVKRNKVNEQSGCEHLPHHSLRNSEYSGSLKMKTEYHWNFQGEKPSITSFIKDKNLSNLKMSYKKQVRI